VIATFIFVDYYNCNYGKVSYQRETMYFSLTASHKLYMSILTYVTLYIMY